jgi:hypothetical protein
MAARGTQHRVVLHRGRSGRRVQPAEPQRAGGHAIGGHDAARADLGDARSERVDDSSFDPAAGGTHRDARELNARRGS